jgi:leader peptidase (prepilin peptidase) / N-methyltransferase
VIPFFFFLFGIVIGSFLNVCISRIPAGESVVSPASHCPRCQKPISWYDNIPVFSWFVLQGKCRNCHLPISPMYPIVEFLTGALFVLTYYRYGWTLPTFKYLILSSLLVILILTDILERILPDAVNWFGFGLGLAFATRVPPEGFSELWFRHRQVSPMFTGVLDALMGAAFGGFLLLLAAMAYKIVRKRDGMGMGDVKMMAMVGAFLGLRGAFLTILVGTLLGSIVGIALVTALYAFGWRREIAQRAHRRGIGGVSVLRWTLASEYQLPLGSFLGVAALVVVYVLPWMNLERLPRFHF